MMIDTGAARNLIKQKVFNLEVPINSQNVLNQNQKFFQDNNENINYSSKYIEIENHCYPFKFTGAFTIPGQTVTTFYVQMKNTERSEGYILQLHIQDGVYLGDAVVKNHKEKLYLKFANTNEIPITLSVPIINLEDLEEPQCYESIENLNNFNEKK